MTGKVFSVGAMVLFAVVLTVAPAWAQGVGGKWTAKVPGAQGQGDSDVTLVL